MFKSVFFFYQILTKWTAHSSYSANIELLNTRDKQKVEKKLPYYSLIYTHIQIIIIQF